MPIEWIYQPTLLVPLFIYNFFFLFKKLLQLLHFITQLSNWKTWCLRAELLGENEPRPKSFHWVGPDRFTCVHKPLEAQHVDKSVVCCSQPLVLGLSCFAFKLKPQQQQKNGTVDGKFRESVRSGRLVLPTAIYPLVGREKNGTLVVWLCNFFPSGHEAKMISFIFCSSITPLELYESSVPEPEVRIKWFRMYVCFETRSVGRTCHHQLVGRA